MLAISVISDPGLDQLQRSGAEGPVVSSLSPENRGVQGCKAPTLLAGPFQCRRAPWRPSVAMSTVAEARGGGGGAVLSSQDLRPLPGYLPPLPVCVCVLGRGGGTLRAGEEGAPRGSWNAAVN